MTADQQTRIKGVVGPTRAGSTPAPVRLRRGVPAGDGDAGGSAQRLAATAMGAANSSDCRGRAVDQPDCADRRRADALIDLTEARIDVVDVPRVAGRPFGPLFGTLVHTTLATVPLDADESIVRRVAATQGRILLGSGEGVEEEVYAVAEAVLAVLRHPLFDEVRAANTAGLCYRELPLIWQSPDGTLIEGTVDLAFEDRGEAESERRLVVLDFKTDRDRELDTERYRRQLAIYCRALMALQGGAARGILMRSTARGFRTAGRMAWRGMVGLSAA